MEELLRNLLVLPEQGSELAREVDHLHYLVIAVTMLGAAAVAAFAVVFVVRYRTFGPAEQLPPRTPRVHGPIWFETLTIGGTLGLFVLFWAIGYRQYLRAQTPPEGATEVFVAAKQWVWTFSYPDGRTSEHALYVPAGRPVKLVLTSRDVIHSFFVPAFRQKKDVVPGRYTVLWFEAARPGTYDAYCTEYCGTGHSLMLGKVVALSGEDYEAWRRGAAPAAERDLAAEGRAVAAAHGCLQCHSLDGSRGVGPTFKDLWGARVLLDDGSRELVDGAYVTESMMEPRARLVAGFAPVMPSYQGRIAPADVARIVDLLRSLSRHGTEGPRARED